MKTVLATIAMVMFMTAGANAATAIYAGNHNEYSRETNDIGPATASYIALRQCQEKDAGCEKQLVCEKEGYGAIVKSPAGNLGMACQGSTLEQTIEVARDKVPFCARYPKDCEVVDWWYDAN